MRVNVPVKGRQRTVKARERSGIPRCRTRRSTAAESGTAVMCDRDLLWKKELVAALRVLLPVWDLGARVRAAAGRTRHRLRLQGRRLLVEVRHAQLALVDRPFLDHERCGRDTTRDAAGREDFQLPVAEDLAGHGAGNRDI